MKGRKPIRIVGCWDFLVNIFLPLCEFLAFRLMKLCYLKKQTPVAQLNKYICKGEVTHSLLHYIWAIRYDLDASH